MQDDSLAEAGRPAVRAAPGLPSAGDRRALLALLAWCLAFLAIRLAEHGTLERDEAEIVYLTQQLRLGYGTQPPLYAWLQWLFFETFGVNRFALLLLKDLALAATCIAMFRTARPLLGRRGVLAVTASLALFPQVGWEALRIQTHSVLMTAIACATLWLYFAMLRRPTPGRYAGFGLLCGLGLQTKYNYGVFLACVLGASLLVRAHRQALWTRRTWVAVLPAVLLVLPHAAWMAGHPALAFGGTLRKMQDGAVAASYLQRVAQGTLGALEASASFVALPALVWAVVCWRRRALWRGRLRFDRDAPASRFFACLYGVCGLLLVALALTGEVGTIKERWMIPLLFSLPLGLPLMFPALDRDAIHADILRVAAVAALGLLILLPARTWLGPAVGKDMTRHHPYAELADVVERQCPQARTIVTESLLSAGNLRFARPAMPSLLLEDARREGMPLARPAALVTHAQDAPAALAVFQAAWPDARLARREVVSLALEDGSGRRMDFMLACIAPDAPP
jgi:4-amino-4-deoxy-L-arabinose transferase-like glycosyltransferase